MHSSQVSPFNKKGQKGFHPDQSQQIILFKKKDHNVLLEISEFMMIKNQHKITLQNEDMRSAQETMKKEKRALEVTVIERDQEEEDNRRKTNKEEEKGK